MPTPRVEANNVPSSSAVTPLTNTPCMSSAAALHLACAVPKADWGVSLTHFYLAEDIVRRPLALAGGLVTLPDGPGLGIEVDEAAVERFRVK